jgi:predicted nucleic acid-binding protein
LSRVVISDASPLRYLVLIGHADVLPALYTDVLIPEAVATELRQPATPEPVRRWITDAPSWLQIVSLATPISTVPLADLDRGEREAILLALELKADLVLMDDRDGVDEARRVGLVVTGTLGVLDRAAERGLIELAPAIASLRETNFRIDPLLLQRLLDSDRGQTKTQESERRNPTDK